MPCGTLDVFTDRQTIVAGGRSWYAFPAIISSQPVPVTYTHHFPDLTMTDLQSLGPAIYWVLQSLYLQKLNISLRLGPASSKDLGVKCTFPGREIESDDI
jgi:hypothetical protein